MNFYVAVVDDLLKQPSDNPTIGLILCKTKDKSTVEYALRNVNSPIGVSTHNLPSDFQASLPTIEQLEMELSSAISADSVDIDEAEKGEI